MSTRSQHAVRRSLAACNAQALRAKNATELLEIASRVIPLHGCIVSARIVGENWPLVSGQLSTLRMIETWINRTLVAMGRHERAAAVLGAALMGDAERIEHAAFVQDAGPHTRTLFRAANNSQRTGWFLTADDACSVWRHARSFDRIESTKIRTAPDRILALKTVCGRTEIVPEPYRARGLAVTAGVLP